MLDTDLTGAVLGNVQYSNSAEECCGACMKQAVSDALFQKSVALLPPGSYLAVPDPTDMCALKACLADVKRGHVSVH